MKAIVQQKGTVMEQQATIYKVINNHFLEISLLFLAKIRFTS